MTDYTDLILRLRTGVTRHSVFLVAEEAAAALKAQAARITELETEVQWLLDAPQTRPS